jgi:NitT/TauT family transport system permease protein
MFAIGLGLGLKSKVALAAVLVFFIVFFNAFEGVRDVDKNLLANARILGASQRQLSTEVIVPAAVSWMLANLHTIFSFALVGAIVGEFLGATEGIGMMIQTAQSTFNANGVFAATAILVVVAVGADALVTWLENRLIRWCPGASAKSTM